MKILYTILLTLFSQIILFSQSTCTSILPDIINTPVLDPGVDYTTINAVFPNFENMPPPPPPPPPSSNYKKIITWVHGMNGNNASWVHASDYADTQYKALPLRVDYNDFQASMSTVRVGIKDDILTQWDPRANQLTQQGIDNSFAIGHSLGGLAVRGASESYDYLEDKINGIVTVNSPHGGSLLAYYVDTPYGAGDPQKVDDLISFAQKSCEVFGAGPLEEELESSGFWLKLVFGFLDRDKILEKVCAGVSNVGVPLVIDNIAPLAVSELNPGAQALNVEERVPDSHKMAFASSIVDDPNAHNSAFKMFYSAQNNPSARAWTKGDELTAEAIAGLDNTRNWYNTKSREWGRHYDSKPWWKASWQCFKTIGIGNCITYKDCRKRRNQYAKGRDQFRKVNDYWEVVVGARVYETTQLGTCEYEDENGDLSDLVPPNEYDIPEDDCGPSGTWIPNEIFSTLKDYDGFLLTESQLAWDDCPDDRKYVRMGSDHLQIKNDSNTEYIVDFTLNGLGAPFFGN